MGWHTLRRQKASQKAAEKQQQQQQQIVNIEAQKLVTKKPEKNTSIKQKYNLQDKNFKNLTIEKPPSPVSPLNKFGSNDDVFADDIKVQTLLARAVYDNHADAPDELSIRKGDIVTVIEKDIDGLTGWWLCLLHGQQGIVPGNRLKVIPPVELDQFERKSSSSKNRASYETDENSDSLDVVDGAPPSNYDYLPHPIKTPGTGQTLSIKDMFNIPIKSKSPNDMLEIYDVPNSLNTTLDTSQEIYDVPSNRNSANLSQSNGSIPTGYDSPRIGRKNVAEPTELYDVPSNIVNKSNPPIQPEPYQVPNKIAAPDELYDVPKSKNSIEVDALMGEILDSPFNVDPSTSTIKRTPLNSNSSTPRSSLTLVSGTEPQELYDVPKNVSKTNGQVKTNTLRRNTNLHSPASANMSHTLPRGFSPKTKNFSQYSTPKGTPTRLQEIYDIPSSTGVKNCSLPGSPLTSRKAKEIPTSEEIYDVPRNEDPTSDPEFLSMLHQLERHETASVLKSANGESNSQELYDVPSNISVPHTNNSISQYQNTSQSEYGNLSTQEDIYNVPPGRNTQTLGRSAKMNVSLGVESQEIYDIPPNKASTPRHVDVYQTPPTSKQNTNAVVEIYDVPSNLSANNTQEIYMTPPTTSRFANSYTASNQEIYDVPPSNTSPRQEIYDVPPSNASQRQEIYDVPPSSYGNTSQQHEIYDVPSTHDVNQVMADVYKSHRGHRNHNNNLLVPGGGDGDDDYVDYADIWNKEPPKELLQQHNKNINGTEASGRPLSSDSSTSFISKRLSSGGSDGSTGKKSVLDQINFEAVKELQLTVSEALERLAKLHLAVDTCVQTLKCFYVDNWLDITLLRTTVPAIRDFSGKLKIALRLLTEFGLGTLVNTTNNINGEALMDKLIGDVEPLLECYYKIKICLMHLDVNNWAVPSNRNSTNDKFFATLNAIMILSERIPDQCRSFTLAVQNNASELFQPDTIVDKLEGQIKNMNVTPSAKQPPQQKIQLFSEPAMSAEALRKELAGRRQQARDATLRPVPRIPPKPNLPNQRRSLAGMIEPGETNARYSLAKKAGYGHIERLVTEYQPENTKQKKYASDPTTPSYTTAQNTMWGGSCPVLLDRNSAGASSSLQYVDTASSCSSVGASIPEETIEIKQTTEQPKSYPSDSNLISPTLTPMHQRSASLPWDDRLKNVFTFDDSGPKSPTISPLDHRDIESLEFFCRQVESQVLLLRESMKNLTESVENREEPVVFVSHSKFIILTAHKVMHSGQEISERLLNNGIKSKIKENTSHLTVCIRSVVAATKTAALDYPEPNSMMEMISSVLALGDAVRIIHSECRHALNA